MKIKTILYFLFLGSVSYSQDKSNINDSNYYDYYVNFPQLKAKGIQGKKITTNWLRKNDVIPIIMEELKNAGYENVSDNVLFKIDENQYFVLSAFSSKSQFGFLYIENHGLPLKKHRKEFIEKKETGVSYDSYVETASKKPYRVEIMKLPENVFTLIENCYWYQYTENPSDQKILVSKDDILKILKDDIKSYLLKAPKPMK